MSDFSRVRLGEMFNLKNQGLLEGMEFVCTRVQGSCEHLYSIGDVVVVKDKRLNFLEKDGSWKYRGWNGNGAEWVISHLALNKTLEDYL